MNWHLIDRTHEEMLDLAATIPAEDIGNLKIFTEADQDLLFLQIAKKSVREVTVATKPHTDVSQHSTQSRVGRVYGADEVREPEVSWCEMPGAVNRAGGCDEFVVEAGILSKKESGSEQ